MTTVITAFDAFGGHRANPSEIVTGELAANRAHLRRVILPTSYRRAPTGVARILDAEPDLLVLFGYTRFADRFTVEQVARNVDTWPEPDNDGVLASGEIAASGPPTLVTTADLAPVAAALARRHLPFVFSTDAGGFVCNHTYYVALRLIARRHLATRCVFIHVPAWTTAREGAAVLAAAATAVDVLAASPTP